MSKEPTQEQIRKILQKHFPELEVVSVERITKGYSSYVYLCKTSDKEVVLRIAVDKDAEFCIKKELWVIDKYQAAEIPVPKIYAFDVSKEELPFEYMLQERLKGTSVKELWNELSDTERVELGFLMGRLMNNMHIVLEGFGEINKDGLSRGQKSAFRQQGTQREKSEWISVLLAKTFHHISELIAMDLITPEQSAATVRWIHSKAELVWVEKPVLVHSDLHQDHIFIQRAPLRITGVCDFEFAAAYAREYEFIKFQRYGLLDDVNFKNALLNGYGRKNLHPRFDEVVGFYRVTRDLGFARFLAVAGNVEKSKETITDVLGIIRA